MAEVPERDPFVDAGAEFGGELSNFEWLAVQAIGALEHIPSERLRTAIFTVAARGAGLYASTRANVRDWQQDLESRNSSIRDVAIGGTAAFMPGVLAFIIGAGATLQDRRQRENESQQAIRQE